MASNLNWFSKVAADAYGNLSLIENNSKAGDYIDLRFEMDTLVLRFLFAFVVFAVNDAEHTIRWVDKIQLASTSASPMSPRHVATSG